MIPISSRSVCSRGLRTIASRSKLNPTFCRISSRPIGPRFRMPRANVCPQCGTAYAATVQFCENDGVVLRAERTASDLPGAIVAGHYRIMRTLGEGANGRVYLAEHVTTGRTCALTLMDAGGANRHVVDRFNREAANASRINHP